jgi:hypothetical protein
VKKNTDLRIDVERIRIQVERAEEYRLAIENEYLRMQARFGIEGDAFLRAVLPRAHVQLEYLDATREQGLPVPRIGGVHDPGIRGRI